MEALNAPADGRQSAWGTAAQHAAEVGAGLLGAHIGHQLHNTKQTMTTMLSKGPSLNLPGRKESVALIESFRTVEELHDRLPFGPQSRSHELAAGLLNNTAAARTAAKGLGIAGSGLAVGLGAWEGYENAKGKTPGEQWAAAIIGGAKEVDNLAVSAGTGAAAFAALAPSAAITLGTGPALAATAASTVFGNMYANSALNSKVDAYLDTMTPALAYSIDAAIGGYNFASEALGGFWSAAVEAVSLGS